MPTPLSFIEDELARKAGLERQVELMENQLAKPRGNPSFGSRSGSADNTQKQIDLLKGQIAEIEERVEQMRPGNA